ncbi:Alpha/Beta hydrolase protein [Phaeosphaeria sp. MPI-PUGE-AT-0046c]|nr:Alpha/Beta hydrolase protein [Phaeosphaeria sp. MPI-PUGE-AT-0046c]
MTEAHLVLPRPGTAYDASRPPIPGPSEALFTQTFGTLLPPAEYLTTKSGKAAYYHFPPSSHTPNPSRVLLIHGIQTPALGMYPLASTLRSQFPSSHFVLFDHWGHGLSDTPFAPHDSALFHTLIDELLNHLSWPSAHLIGFSFGGALSVGYVASRRARVQSFTLVAPAGLIRRSGFDDAGLAHLRGGGDEVAAATFVINNVLGGIDVPEGWQERVKQGEVVPMAIKEWEMREHKGHVASVVAIFRDGGVLDNDEVFVEAAKSGVPNLVVLGEEDDICTKEQLEEIGFKDVKVIPTVGHEVVRQKAKEVGEYIADFWKGLDETK